MGLSSCKLLGSFITNRLFANSVMDTKEKCLIRSAIHISLPDVLTISWLHQNLHCIPVLPFLEFWEHNATVCLLTPSLVSACFLLQLSLKCNTTICNLNNKMSMSNLRCLQPLLSLYYAIPDAINWMSTIWDSRIYCM